MIASRPLPRISYPAALLMWRGSSSLVLPRKAIERWASPSQSGLAISLWSANAAMKSLFGTLNIVYGEQEKRGFFKLNAMSRTFTVAAIGVILAALAAVVAIPIVLRHLWLSDPVELLIRFAAWPAMFVAVALGLSCI